MPSHCIRIRGEYLQQMLKIIPLTVHLNEVDQTLHGRDANVNVLPVGGVRTIQFWIRWQMATFLQFPNHFEAGDRHTVFVGWQMLFQIEETCHFLENKPEDENTV